MNYLLAKSHLTSFLSSHPKNNSSFRKITNIADKFFHLLLGICSAAVALPLFTLAIVFSVFLPQEKWDEFWDEFLEA